MYVSDVRQLDCDEHRKVTKPFLSDLERKKVRNAVEDVVESEFYRLQECANEYIGGVAASRAEAFLDRVLQGDEEAAKKLFDCGNGSRYQGIGYGAGKPWASVIHGHIFETTTIKLRRELVEAHADLLRNERIADLESIAEGLRQQIVKLEKQLEDARR